MLNLWEVQWCGRFDRMDKHTPEETERRQQLAMGLFEARGLRLEVSLVLGGWHLEDRP